MSLQHVSRASRIYTLDPDNRPAATIRSGDELIVETWDAFEGVRDAALLSERALLGPATGPIYVDGAQPGDALRVELIGITPWGDAVHLVRPGRGFLEEEFNQPYATVLSIDGGDVVVARRIRIPLAASVGFVATTPTYRQSTASDSGPYGGDFDMKELCAGCTLYLPVFVPGGLLALGDCHAVVGDGAVAGTGAECAAEIQIRVTVEKGMRLTSPRALTANHLIVLAYGEQLGPAMKQAVRAMVDYLMQEKGMDPYDAYTLLSLAGDIRVSRTFRPISPVKMMLSRRVLDQL
jgi:amidase